MNRQLLEIRQINNSMRALCLLLMGTLLCNPQARASALLDSYWPLHDGDNKTLTYGTETLTLDTSSTSYNQFRLYVDSSDVSGYETYQINADSIQAIGGGVGWARVSLNPYVTFLTDNLLRDGGTVSSMTTATQSGVSYAETYKVTVTKSGTVTVPAGTFTDCRTLATTVTATVPGQGSQTASTSVILAPSVGIIKKQVRAGTWAVLTRGTVDGIDVTKSVPTILTQPANQTVLAGNTATFTVTANGRPDPTIIWQSCPNGSNVWSSIAGASGTTYTTPATAFADNGTKFRCVASNGFGTPATSNAAVLTVNKPLAKVTLTGLSQTYSGLPRSVTAVTIPAGLTLNITYNSASDVPVNAGSYPVAATITDPNYMGSASGTLIITKGTQTITFPAPPPLRNGDPDVTLTARSTSGMTVSYACSNTSIATIVDGNKLHIIGAGSVIITATQPGDPNWLAATAVKKTLTIGKRGQVIDFAAFSSHQMGDADFDAAASASSGLTVTYASATPAVATIVNGKIHLKGKGSTVITASQAGNTAWAAATPVKQTLTVAAGTQTITFPPLAEKGYGDPDFAPGATATSGLTVSYVSSNPAVATIVSGKIHIIACGTATISANQPGNANWTPATAATQELTVSKGTPVLTWANPAAITYGTALSATQLNAKANVAGAGVYTPVLGSKLPVGAQTLSVIFTPTDSARYNTATKSVPLTVNKAAATITLAGLSQSYTGQPRLVTATTLPAGLNVDITYNGSPDAPVNVGSYPVVATVNDPNATGTKTGTLVIGKGNQTISFTSLPAMHVGDADRSLTATAASGLPVSYASSNTSIVTIVDGNKLHAVATGSTFITATQAGDANWNAALAVKQLLTVPSAPPLPTPDGFALIPAGSFQMGNALAASEDGDTDELPVHTVQVSAFYMAKYEVTKALWDAVRTWGLTHGYTDLPVGSMYGSTNYSRGPTHPVHNVIWYDVVKWCNARSEKEGLTPCYKLFGAVYRTSYYDAVVCNWNATGYRLPTEAEWEKAARGGLIGKRFPWGNTISQSQANYCSDHGLPCAFNFDLGPEESIWYGTSPVGSFPANGYGLFDMAGNVRELCWDWYSSSYYAASPGTDPRGAGPDSDNPLRVLRGGDYGYSDYGDGSAYFCRVACRWPFLNYVDFDIGFRVARSSAF